MRLIGSLGWQIIRDNGKGNFKIWKDVGNPWSTQPAKSNPNGPDTVCLLCPSHNLAKSNAKTSKCCFYRNIFNVNTCQVLNTSFLHGDFLPCDMSIPYECLNFQLCSGFIDEKDISE